MKVVLYSGSRLAKGADVALRARLYVSGWRLSRQLVKMRSDDTAPTLHIAVCFVGSTPVAVALNTGWTVMAFCKKAHRRNGYASACVQALPAGSYERAEIGIDHSHGFWKKNQVTVR